MFEASSPQMAKQCSSDALEVAPKVIQLFPCPKGIIMYSPDTSLYFCPFRTLHKFNHPRCTFIVCLAYSVLWVHLCGLFYRYGQLQTVHSWALLNFMSIPQFMSTFFLWFGHGLSFSLHSFIVENMVIMFLRLAWATWQDHLFKDNQPTITNNN